MRCASFLTSILALTTLVACGGGGTGNTGGSGGGSGGSTGTSTLTNVMACSDISTNNCFSNADCSSASDRCQVVGMSDAPVACCVPGARGSGMGGDPCAGENDCDTAVCLVIDTGNLCSKACTGDADCPASIPTCIAIDPSVGTGAFCAPTPP